MKLDLRHLKLVVAVTEENSVTKAGERLHVTQSALSHQLREIEERLGAALFHRVNKRMVLTQAGERLLETAYRVLGEIERVESDLTKLTVGDTGRLRVSTECYTCYHWLPEVVTEFNRSFPNVEIQIVVEATRRPVRALYEGKIDVAIVSSPERDKRLDYLPLFRDELMLVAAAGCPLASRDYVRPKDFADQTLFLIAPESESDVYNRVLAPAGVRPRQTYEVPLTEAVVEMVAAGLGVAVLAGWAVAAYEQSGRVVARRVTRTGLFRDWNAAVLHSGGTPAYIAQFASALAKTALPGRSARRVG